jgi:hypothetical protein
LLLDQILVKALHGLAEGGSGILHESEEGGGGRGRRRRGGRAGGCGAIEAPILVPLLETLDSLPEFF